MPITVAAQVESLQDCFEAGAAIAHCHVRNDDQSPSADPETFARLMEGIRKHCLGIIVHVSTGGRPGAGAVRGGMPPFCPDMASLAVGSNSFPTRVYGNPPDLVDWLASEMQKSDVKPEIAAFDLSHIFQAVKMSRDSRLKAPLYVQFAMGVRNVMPADRPSFEFYVETLKRIAPDAEWCGAGIGRHQIEINEWSIAPGGHTRTGLEDNVRLDNDRLAPSTAALVRRAAELCARHGRPVASPIEARAILGLPPVPAKGV